MLSFALLFPVFSLPAAPKIKKAWYQSDFPQAGLPLVKNGPEIDGKFNLEEWKESLAFTGLYSRWAYILPAPMQGWVFLSYDQKWLYVGLRSLLPPDGVNARTTQHDAADRIEGEDHWTVIFILREATYQFHVNALGTYSDQCLRPEDRGKPYHQAGLEWESQARVKAGRGETTWDVEMAIPFSSFGLTSAPEEGSVWRGLFIRERTYPGLGSAAYGEWNGSVHYSPGDAGALIFSGKVPAFQLLETGDLRGMKSQPVFRLSNPWSETRTVSLRYSVESGDQSLFEEKKELALKPAETVWVRPDLRVIELRKGWSGRFCVEASSGSDHLYNAMLQFFPVTPKEYRRLAHWPYGTWPYESELKQLWELGCAHYPYFQSMDLWVNTSYSFLPEEVKKAARCQLRLTRLETGQFLRQETIPLKEGKGNIHWDNLKLEQGQYRVTGELFSAEGQIVGKPVTLEFVRKLFPWEHNRIGFTDQAYAPFRPIRVDRAKMMLSPWGRQYYLGDLGLPASIVTTEETELPGTTICGPVRLEVNSVPVNLSLARTTITRIAPARVDCRAEAKSGDLHFSTESFLRCDGWYQVKLTIAPSRPAPVEKMELVIPLGRYPDTYYGYRSNWFYGALPATPEPWSNLTEKKENLFTPAIAVGNGDVSLWWYADSDQTWLLDYSLPSQAITRDQDGVNLRIRFVNAPRLIKQPLQVTFALLAVPVKPEPPDRRSREWGEIPWKIQDTAGYGYWGNGVDSITPGSEEDYERLGAAIEKWKRKTFPQGVPENLLTILYNSGAMLGQAMEEFDTFSGEWCGETPVEPFPEYKDSDVHARVPWHGPEILQQDWRSQPKKLGPTGADLVQSNVDCRIWHYKQNCQKLGINGYWFDNQPVWPGKNVSTGRAYLTSEGQLRPNYCLFARDELFWRLFNLTREAGLESCNLVSLAPVFSTAGWVWNIEMDAYIYRYGGDLFETLEQRRHYDIISRVVEVEATPLDPVGRFRAITRMRRIPGHTCTNLDQSPAAVHGSRSVLGLNLLHDFGVDGSRVNKKEFEKVVTALRRFGFFTEKVKFLPYWRNSQYVSFSRKNGLVSLYRNEKTGAILAVVVNPEKEVMEGELTLSVSSLAGKAGQFQDAEIGQALAPFGEKEKPQVKLTVPGREFRLILFQSQP
ncbi:MAG TPA: DUF6067 family protein [bacterium]|nr:DUF6067 family protein [bacterium]